MKKLTTFSISMGTEAGSSANVASVDNESNKDNAVDSDAPQVGMTFDDCEEMFEFLKTYARRMGFPVRKRSRKKDADGIVKYLTYTCALEGKRESTSNKLSTPKPDARTGCKAKLSARLEPDNKWLVTKVELIHNHPMNPSMSRFYKCNRQTSTTKKRLLETNDDGTEKHCKIEKGKRLRFEEGDVIAMQSYFLKMQDCDTSFFFNMDLDEDGRLKNVFWADGRIRKAYKDFGEVITFDTTYLTKKYEVPIVLFLGVNHHGQSTVLGCGLVSGEDTETFVWLIKTWLVCMGHCAPQGIITDYTTDLQNAVETVLPNTRHRWCLSHVMKKVSTSLSSHEHFETIGLAVEGLVYDTQTPTEFEQSWIEMLDKYELHQNEFLSGLYAERHRWVPCYVKTHFWAGMSTSQRNESMNSFFHGYVNSKTTLKQFMEQYDKAMMNEVEKETSFDLKSFSQMVPCVTTFELEKQIQSVYTISKFKEFQNELTGQLYCRQVSTRESYMVSEYDIREDIVVGEGKKRMIYTVSFKGPECEIQCSCHTFEFRGILCRHVVFVLIQNDVVLIPDKYILRRWRKDVRRSYTLVKINYGNLEATPEQVRYDQLRGAVTEVAELAAGNEDHYREVMEWIDYLKAKLPASKSSRETNNPAPKSNVDMNLLFEVGSPLRSLPPLPSLPPPPNLM